MNNGLPRTIHYGDRPEVTVDNDRTGLPDDCPCTAVRWCGGPPHIQWPNRDCRHHGHGLTDRLADTRPMLRLDLSVDGETSLPCHPSR